MNMNIKDYNHLSSVWTHSCDKTVVSGKGCRLYTEGGGSLLDFTSGIGVISTGHSHPKVSAAIGKQAETLLFSQINCAFHNRVFELAEELRSILPPELSRYFFAQSGAEAIEGAVKLAKHATRRPNIIVLNGSFHGRTHLAMAMTTSKTSYRISYPNLPAGIFVAPYPYAFASGRTEEEETKWALDSLKMLLETQSAPCDTAAVFIEPVLGEGGYLPLAKGYMQGLRELCDTHGILLVADEIQSGFGRTGKMFAFEWDGIIPDIVTMAKGLASGAPISAIAYREELDSRWLKGSHGGTYNASPLGCAAAIATIKVIKEEQLVENSLSRGEELMEKLRALKKEFPVIADVRGRGLMIGVELMRDGNPASDLPGKIVAESLKLGLMILSCGIRKNVIRWIPPLVVTSQEIQEGINLFTRALRSLKARGEL
jgi:4-aminobutyrate aminotransferase